MKVEDRILIGDGNHTSCHSFQMIAIAKKKLKLPIIVVSNIHRDQQFSHCTMYGYCVASFNLIYGMVTLGLSY